MDDDYVQDMWAASSVGIQNNLYHTISVRRRPARILLIKSMLASAIADELARKRGSSGEPPSAPPTRRKRISAASPRRSRNATPLVEVASKPTLISSPSRTMDATTPAEAHSKPTSDRSKQRLRRYTPYGPIPIKFGQTIDDQITEIQREQHKVASHDYFLTAPENRGKIERPKEPTGIWGFDKADVESYPVLRKRNFFCIQHHR